MSGAIANTNLSSVWNTFLEDLREDTQEEDGRLRPAAEGKEKDSDDDDDDDDTSSTPLQSIMR